MKQENIKIIVGTLIIAIFLLVIGLIINEKTNEYNDNQKIRQAKIIQNEARINKTVFDARVTVLEVEKNMRVYEINSKFDDAYYNVIYSDMSDDEKVVKLKQLRRSYGEKIMILEMKYQKKFYMYQKEYKQ